MDRHIVLLTMLLSSGAMAQSSMFSDEFNSGNLDARWDTSNANPDSHITVGSGTLILDASPLMGGSDYFDQDANWRAPRIVQPVCGDWTILARMIVDPFTGDYQDAGILLFKEDTSVHYNAQRIMMRRFKDGDCPPDFQDFRLLYNNYCDFDANSMWMTLEHKGDSMIGRVSADSITWEREALKDTADFRYIGLIAVRKAWDMDFSARTVARFDYFRVLDQDTLHVTAVPANVVGYGNAVTLSVDTVTNGAYAWYAPDGAYLGGSSEWVIGSVDTTDSGWYHVTVSRLDCQFLTDSIFLEVVTGVGVHETLAAGPLVFPDPVNGNTLTVSRNAGTIRKIEVFDMQGANVQSLAVLRPTNHIDLDVGDLRPGVYLVRSSDGQSVFHARFIKE